MMGFIKMGGGFLGGMAAARLGKPLSAFGTVIPTMTIIAFAAYLALQHFGRRLEKDTAPPARS